MPDIEKLDLSDSDPHYLFASPSQQDKKSALNRKDKETELSNDQSTHKARNGESRYDSEEAREASLRNELESVRSINQVMEGVIESLERAKGNMEVRQRFHHDGLDKADIMVYGTECFTHCKLRIYAFEYLDPNTFPD